MLQKRLSALCAFFAIAVAACGGGSQSNASYPNVPVASGPAANGTYTASGPSGSRISLTLSASGAVTTGTQPTFSVTAGSGAPSNAGTLQSAQRRAAQAQIRPLSSGDTSILYITVASNLAANVNSVSGLGVNLTSTPPSGPIYLAYYNGSQWVTIGVAAVVTGDTITFAPASGSTSFYNFSPAYPIPAGGSLDLVVYQGVVLTTPTPEPPAPVASPDSATLFYAAGSGTSTTINVTTGPDTTITGSSSNTAVATVTSSVTTASSGAGDTTAAFTVTATGLGTANVTFTDPLGRATAPVAITVTNVPPSPNASPETIMLGATQSVTVNAYPNDSITAASSNTGVVTVNSPVESGGNGAAVFTLTPVAGGVATITFEDTLGDTGTMAVTVSAVKNGTFVSTANWTACSYAHPGTLAPTNASTPVPPATPNPTPTLQDAADAATPNPIATIPAMAIATPPPNSNPYAIAIDGTPAPSVLGASVAYTGSINTATIPLPAGEFGICQVVAVPATGASSADELSFWVYEGGNEDTFAYADQDAVVLDSTGTTVEQTLFAEQNCYVDPTLDFVPGAKDTSGCWPATYGGDIDSYFNWTGGGYWAERGPYDLSAEAGTTVTLYLGGYLNESDNGTYAESKYGQFMYVGNVQMTGSSSFPTAAPLSKRRTFSMSIRGTSTRSSTSIRH